LTAFDPSTIIHHGFGPTGSVAKKMEHNMSMYKTLHDQVQCGGNDRQEPIRRESSDYFPSSLYHALLPLSLFLEIFGCMDAAASTLEALEATWSGSKKVRHVSPSK
jgi:hypothetical protein